MLFSIRAAADVPATADFMRESERRLRFATDRFQPRIRELGIVLRDLNGPRGGRDKYCRVVAKLHHGGALSIEETRSSFIEALRRAARRLRMTLSRQLGGKRPYNTLRNIGAGSEA